MEHGRKMDALTAESERKFELRESRIASPRQICCIYSNKGSSCSWEEIIRGVI